MNDTSDKESPVASVITLEQFTSLVDNKVYDLQMSYMEAITEVCKDEKIDVENVSPLISPSIKRLLEAEALNLNLIKYNGSKLPI